MWRGPVLVLALAAVASGCGEVENGGGGDARVDATSVDAAVDAPGAPCNRDAPFQLTPLTGLNSSGSEGYAWFTDDLLTAYVGSNTGGGPGSYDIYRSTRASVTADFAARVAEQGVSTSGDERGPVLSRDRKTIYFSRLAASGTHYDIYIASRSDAAAAFGAGELMTNVNGPSDDHATYISDDGLRLYLSSLRTGNWENYLSTRASTSDPFEPPQPIGALNSAGVLDSNLVLAADELTAYFGSDRSGSQGADIWKATRTTVTDGFGQPQREADLSSSSDDWPVWSSPDGCQLVIASTRPGGGGQDSDLWLASRPRL